MLPRGYYQPRTGAMRTSETSVKAKFAEFPFHALEEEGREPSGPAPLPI
jgi:hypothetical protein